MIFSGALIDFENFNNKFHKRNEIPLFAGIVPLRWASEAIITQLFLENNYERNFTGEKILFYESLYYLDFVIPEIRKIYAKDSIKAQVLFDNEFNIGINSLEIKENSLDVALNIAEDIFMRQKINTETALDNIYAKLNNPVLMMTEFSNKAVNSIISRRNISLPYIIKNQRFERKYMISYHISRTLYENNSFLIGIKKCGNFHLRTCTYNILILVLYNILIISLLFILVSFNNKHQK
jgi:hypothetical protein